MSDIGWETVVAEASAVVTAGDGDQTIVAAPGENKRIVVTGVHITYAGNFTLTAKSGTDAMTAAMPPESDGGGTPAYVGKHDSQVSLICGSNKAFVLSWSGAATGGGWVSYRVERLRQG